MRTFKKLKSLADGLAERQRHAFYIRQDLFNCLASQSFSLYSKDLLAHFGCVNAVEFSEDGSAFVSGSDDRRVLLWKISDAFQEKNDPKPIAMDAEHGSNVFCLSITPDKERIISGGNDLQVIVHDSNTAKPVDYFLHEKPIYGISIQTDNPTVFSTSSEDGKVRIFDNRSSVQELLASRRSPIHSVMFHPSEAQLLAIASAKEGVELLDIRFPEKCLKRYSSPRGAMSARFNSTGDKLMCLRRRESPIIYSVYSDDEVELHSEGYSNACTMKSCCFAGSKDEWAVSGSDDHNLYVWRVPTDFQNVERENLILKGHRSVVNHVRYNDSACCLASSGVEKMIKFWSPISFPGSTGGTDKEAVENFKPRKRFTRRDFSMIIAPSPNVRLSTEEDKKMIAFFDLLVERSAWVSSGDDSDEEEEPVFTFDISSSRSSSEESGESDEESFQIDMLSTPSSSSSSESSDSEPVAGPSGLNWGNVEQEEEKLDLPSAFDRLVNRPRAFSSSSSDDDFESRDFPLSQETEESEAQVSFRRVTKKGKRELRARARSSSSSDSSYY